jgi:hypothetical protein
MRHATRVLALACIWASAAAAQQAVPTNPILLRSAFGVSLLGLAPKGEFANNVNVAGGFGLNGLLRLDPQGIIALRADFGLLIYGHEHYRTPLGGGPLGLISVDVNTMNNIVFGGIGLQVGAPGATVRPYANLSAGFSSFFTTSSVEGSGNSESFASTTNYKDAGFAWSGGGGVYIPVSVRRLVVNLDIGVRWMDNGKRDYLRDDGITFFNNSVQMHPVRSEAKGLQINLGVTFSHR